MQPRQSSARAGGTLAAALLALVAWSGAIARGGFAYDDREAIFDNPVVTGALPASEAFRRDYWHHVGDAGHWRPLATLSLRLDHALFGEHAAGYHLSSVLLHVLVVLLLGALGARLAERTGEPGAALGVLVFAVHPSLADSVAWISGRTSSLCAAAGLAGALALCGVCQRPRHALARAAASALAAGVGLFGALCAKEDGLVFALVYALVALARLREPGARGATPVCAETADGVTRPESRGRVKPRWLASVSPGGWGFGMEAEREREPLPRAPRRAVARELAPIALGSAAALAAWLALRSAALATPFAPVVRGPELAGRALLEALRLAAAPLDHPPSYARDPSFDARDPAWPGPAALLAWLPVLAALVVGAMGVVAAARGRGRALVPASAALAAAALLPLPLLAAEVFAPRFLYLPLALGAPAVHALVARIGAALPSARVRAAGLALCCALAIGLAWRRAGDYAGRDAFWRAVLRASPSDPRAWNELGLAREEQGERAAARAAFERASRLDPRYSRAWSNLGRLDLAGGDLAAAEESLRRAVATGPKNPLAHCNLASLLLRGERAEEAATLYRRAAELAPGLVAAWRGLGNAELRLAHAAAAQAALERALRLDPRDAAARELLRRAAR